jgi:hypothetical protein
MYSPLYIVLHVMYSPLYIVLHVMYSPLYIVLHVVYSHHLCCILYHRSTSVLHISALLATDLHPPRLFDCVRARSVSEHTEVLANERKRC